MSQQNWHIGAYLMEGQKSGQKAYENQNEQNVIGRLTHHFYLRNNKAPNEKEYTGK